MRSPRNLLNRVVSLRLLSRPTDSELSCEHPPVELNEEKMAEGRREVAG